MSIGSVIYLLFILIFFAGGFIFFIVMDFINERKPNSKNKRVKTKKSRKIN